MSAIGDYVHLTWQGYIDGNLPEDQAEFKGKLKLSDADKSMDNARRRMRKRWEKMQKENLRQQLQQRFNLMMDWLGGKGDTELSERMRDAYDKIKDKDIFQGIEFTNEYGLEGKAFSANVSEDSMEELVQLKKRIKEVYNTIADNKKERRIINKAIENLIKIRKEFVAFFKQHQDIGDLVKNREAYNTVLSTTNKFLRQFKIAQNNSVEERWEDRTEIKSNKVIGSYFKINDSAINDKINNYQKVLLYINKEKKLEGSHVNFLSAMVNIINGLIYKDWRQKAGFFAEYLFEEGFKIAREGGEALAKNASRPSAATRTLKGKEIYGLTSIETSAYKRDNTNLILNSLSPVKVDLEVFLPEGQANISLKNTSAFEKSYGWISIVSGISLLSIMQGENIDNFVNHYLNLVVPHVNDKTSSNNIKNENEAIINKAHNTMKLLVALKALTGSNILIEKTFMSVADFFVTIDNKKNQVYVFSTGDIMEILDDAIFNKDQSQNAVSGYSKDWFNGTNRKVENKDNGVNQRIVNIIQKAYDTKIHMKISTAILRLTAKEKYNKTI